MKRKIKVTITKIRRIGRKAETQESIIFCPICHDFVEIVTFDESNEMLDWLIATKKVHFNLITGRGVQICKTSLLQNDSQKEFEMFWSIRH